MRINTSYVQKCKTVAHIFQLLFAFVAGCITIAVYSKGGTTSGATGYYMALCLLTGPALLYLTMTPMWSRAARFANAYAFLALDALYTILWFVAFIAVAVWNSKGIRQGAEEAKVDKKNCTTFKFGPEAKCNLSRVTVGLGVMICIFFILTTAISAYYMHAFRKEGSLPYESVKPNPHHESGEGGKDNAWSTEIENEHRSDSLDEGHRIDPGGNQHEDEYALLHGTETDDGRHPGRPLSWGEDRHARYAEYDGAPVDGATALSPGGYEDYRKDVAGGTAPGGFGGKGYSFGGR